MGGRSAVGDTRRNVSIEDLQDAADRLTAAADPASLRVARWLRAHAHQWIENSIVRELRQKHPSLPPARLRQMVRAGVAGNGAAPLAAQREGTVR